MERKLTQAQQRALLALVQERDQFVREAEAAIGEMVKAWAGDIERPKVEPRQDGLYIVEDEDAQDLGPVTTVEQ